jgi:dihydroflavonol-4-reductase
LPATIDGGQSWVDVRDVAASAIAASRAGRPGERYLLDGHWLAMPELARLAARVSRARAPLFKVPTRLARAFAPIAEKASKLAGVDPLFTAASVDALEPSARPSDVRARAELGHGPRPTEDTLRDTFRWFEEQGMLKARSTEARP